jgi:hypothetical protein
MLLNLKVNSTQCNKSYYIVVKQNLNKNLSVSAAYKAIITQTKLLAKEYNKQINNNQKNNLTLIDLKAFAKARSKLTHYAINKIMAKWRATKDFANAINNSNRDPFKFKEAIRCLYKYKLLLRFGLPYKH